jgi:hypothetical protein
MTTVTMCYIARDKSGVGAYAICVDDPRWAKDTAATVAKWIADGATVERVTLYYGKDELGKWVRPVEPTTGELPL